MSTSALLHTVGRSLDRLGLKPGGQVVAVSGGPDSVALLHLLLDLRREADASPGSAGPLVIAHLNHQLRGAESDEDEVFVRDLYESLLGAGHANLQLRTEQVDVQARAASEKGNLEAVARRIRYDWLARRAREAGVPFVCTGHTADDQAETVLHRLLRGTGLQGLQGIHARRSLAPGVEVVRPLLEVRRSELLHYLRERNQAYRTDSSNARREHTRNRIRHELLPQLAEAYNPSVVAVLCRLAEQAGASYARDEAEGRRLLAEAELPPAGTLLIFDRGCLATAPRHLVREVFRQAWLREGWPLGTMGFREWERLADVAAGAETAADLPGGIRARGVAGVVQLGRVP